MSTSVTSCALVGVDPRLVRLEASLSGGRSQFIIVGLPDAAVRESRERVRSALKQSGYRFPPGRVVVSLSPADLPKAGAMYDLAIALCLVNATEGLGPHSESFVAMGELTLHGAIKPTVGAVVAASVAEDLNLTALVPVDSSIPAGCQGKVVGAMTLREAVGVIKTGKGGTPIVGFRRGTSQPPDLADVRGQFAARRALEVAAAGGHHLLMVGPPGSGKSMLAQRLPSIIPSLSPAAQREVALVMAASGMETADSSIPPFRAPHHSISIPAMVGGGSGIPKPGEITRAHRGVLFLDELGEFPPAVLDALRQPMESGNVLVSRQAASVLFPSEIQVVAASNPCPCGYKGDRKKECSCNDTSVERYRTRLSGPLVDRFDVRVHVERLGPTDLRMANGETSRTVRARVESARSIQAARGRLNRSLSGTELLSLEDSVSLRAFLATHDIASTMTARGWDRVRRVARTIADLAGDRLSTDVHLKEAMDMRGGFE
jgi:magnesium chelatase family protein